MTQLTSFITIVSTALNGVKNEILTHSQLNFTTKVTQVHLFQSQQKGLFSSYKTRRSIKDENKRNTKQILNRII